MKRILAKVLRGIVLPSEISDFERRYLARMNRVALIFFALHVPVFTFVAWANGTSPLLALLLTTLVVAGPALAGVTLSNPRFVSVIHGVTAMFMGGLLVHFGQGPMQIEMHFYFFSLLAMCAVFGNPMVIVAAALTVTLHHVIVWLALPSSVFNYDASAWVVAVHAGFVVLESVATCFIARSFFDNVIGLEKIVNQRTLALNTKNRDMRRLLDNVHQGFLTIDSAGNLAYERSAAVDTWFGAPSIEMSWFDYLAQVSPEFAARSRQGWEEVAAAIMPVELTIEQMPHRLVVADKIFQVDYRPIGTEPFESYLVIITDVTSDVARENAETERGETLTVFERVLFDRAGFETFFEEGSTILSTLTSAVTTTDLVVARRLIHTLKGNASLFGLSSVAVLCHRLEDLMLDERRVPNARAYHALSERWSRLAADATRLLGAATSATHVDARELDVLVDAVAAGESKETLTSRIRALALEPTKTRLDHFADQAQRIAERVGKEGLVVRVVDNDVRLDSKRWAPLWSALIHSVRNAIDHGIESPEQRIAAGKTAWGVIELRTASTPTHTIFEVEDDGAGIDWEALRSRAVSAGLRASTTDDLTAALFSDGISTVKAVTELSGRGVGMGALRDVVRSLHGELIVKSVSGRGTCLTMTFANDLSASARPSRAA